MKTTKKVMVEQEEIDDIFCNMCGDSCIDKHVKNAEGLIEVQVSGGYGSDHIGDGIEYTFSLCERCVMDAIRKFKIPAEKKDWMATVTKDDLDYSK